MTEEQEKEIDVALWSWVILTPHERRRKYKGLMKLIRTVVAEARKEGYQQAIDDAISGRLIIGVE